MAIELENVASGFSTGIINDNFRRLEEYINDNLLNRDGTETGEANQMELPLDMNSFPILNATVDPEDPGSLLTRVLADSLYVKLLGDTMQGSLDMDTYPVFVRVAVNGNEPARKDELDLERSQRIAADNTVTENYQAADASLQAQITEAAPIAAAERPIIQWHAQEITNSATVPEDVNAFTVGPTFRIAEGQSVTVGESSFWTILNGAESGNIVTATVDNFDEGTL